MHLASLENGAGWPRVLQERPGSHLRGDRTDKPAVRTWTYPLVLSLVTALTACTHGLDPGEQDAPGDGAPAEDTTPLPVAAGSSDVSGDPAETAPGNGPGGDPSPSEPPLGSNPPADAPNDDGVVPAGEPGPPPSQAGQSCTEWTDCGPHYGDLNSGFDCVATVCSCDATGQWAQVCANVGGSWSGFECFCFTNTSTAMPTAAPERPDQAAEDVECWWSWRHSYCDPDRWVDRSYYERVCDSRGCWNEYVEDGHWEDGQCYGRWIKRCTDGNEYWY